MLERMWIDKLPKYHAKKYIDECKKQYLMLDFYEYKNKFINIKKS